MGNFLNLSEVIRRISRRRELFWEKQSVWEEVLHPCFGDRKVAVEHVKNLASHYKKGLENNIQKYRTIGMNMLYERDRRDEEIYIYDVVEGWFVEEIIASWLDCQLKRFFPDTPVVVKFSGKDKDREFVFSKKTGDEVSTAPDFEIILPGGKFVIELQTSRYGKRDLYDIKEPKRMRLTRTSGFLLFALLPKEPRFFLIPNEDLSKLELHKNNAWGGKITAYVTHEQIEKHGWGYFDFSEGLPSILRDRLNAHIK